MKFAQKIGMSLVILAFSSAVYSYDGGYCVIKQMHQAEAENVEKSDITTVKCANKPDQEYYIYRYFRVAPKPNYRAILPPNWGAPLGGEDYYRFEDAISAACQE